MSLRRRSVRLFSTWSQFPHRTRLGRRTRLPNSRTTERRGRTLGRRNGEEQRRWPVDRGPGRQARPSILCWHRCPGRAGDVDLTKQANAVSGINDSFDRLDHGTPPPLLYPTATALSRWSWNEPPSCVPRVVLSRPSRWAGRILCWQHRPRKGRQPGTGAELAYQDPEGCGSGGWSSVRAHFAMAPNLFHLVTVLL